MDEDRLIQDAIRGEMEALSALLRRHTPELRSRLKIYASWQSVLDVDDILQVTFTEAFLRITSFIPAGSGAFLAWLTRIADNNLKDAIKGLQRQKRPPPARQAAAVGGESVVELFELLGVTTTTPSVQVAKREMTGALERALAALPEDYARVVRAYDLEGHSIEETARAMQRGAGAVHMLRARAHGRLRELFGQNPFLSVSH
jgi:RNA polymerase sigma factor (sigma-70 family)